MQKKWLSGIGFLFSFMSLNLWAAGSDYSAVGSHSCALMKNSTKPFILVLKKGEQVQSAITRCADDAQLKGAVLSGLGAFQPVTLRYFDHVAKEYHDKKVDDFMEVTNLTGNITYVNKKHQNHIHVTLSDHAFKPQAGHLKDATVGAVLEVQVTPLKREISKHFDNKTGLDVITTPDK